MAKRRPPRSPDPATTTPASAGLPRRDFLRLGVGVLLSGCSDGASGEDESAGDTTTTGDTITTDTGAPESTTDESTSTSTTTTTTTGDPTTTSTTTTTTGETTIDETTVGDTTSTTTGDELCAGELLDFDPDSLPIDAQTFPLAVMAGEMKPTSVMLTAAIADAAPKTLRVWRTTDTPGVVDLVHEAEVVPSPEGLVKLTVDGLCPGTWYRYGYFAGDGETFTARSIVGEVRTAIADDALEPLTIAMTACNGSSLDWPALAVTADEYYDIFCHLGDMAYCDGSETLAEYRAVWREYLGAAGFKAVLSRAGLYATWDDHEIDDNSNFDRETMNPSELARRQNAMDAYFEVMPIDAEGPNYQLWRSFRWGLSAEIIVLDCRYERRPSMDQYISPAQMAFLKDRLQNSPCHFKVVMNSVPITNMPLAWDVAANDRWEGYPGQRDEVLAFINQHQITNVWFLSGDFHVCFVSRLDTGSDLASRTREIAVTGGNENPIPEFLTQLDPPRFDYGVHRARACVLVFDPEADAVNVRFLDPQTGEDLYNETLTQT